MKNILKNKTVQSIMQALPFIVMVAMLIVYLFTKDKFTVENLLSFTPENYFLAAGFMLLLFAVKSVSVAMPVLVLYIATGSIFPLFPALMLNFAGEIVCVVIAYWVGRYAGSGITDKLVSKYPKVKAIVEKQQKKEWFLSYFLRVCPLPHSAVSLYLGSMKISFHKFLIAGFVGELPAVIYSTLIGAGISQQNTMMLVISAVVTSTLSISSYLLYKHMEKAKLGEMGDGLGNAGNEHEDI